MPTDLLTKESTWGNVPVIHGSDFLPRIVIILTLVQEGVALRKPVKESDEHSLDEAVAGVQHQDGEEVVPGDNQGQGEAP